METKNLLKSLKRRFSGMLCLVMFLAVSQGAWAAYWTNTIYASNSEQKDLYYYSFESETLGGWPGTKMTYVGCKDGKHYYSLNVTNKTGFSKIILNDGKGNQSANLNAPTSTNDCYDWPSNSWGKASLNEKTYIIQFKRPNSWSYTPHIHIFNGCGTFVDSQEMTAVTGASGWYSYELKTNNTACDLIFNNGGWNGQSNTKTGWTIADACFTCSGSNTDITTTTCPVICTTPTATQYSMTNATKTYGSVTAPTITPATGAGTVETIYYTGINGTTYTKSSTLPTNAGTYKVTVDVNAGSTYCAKDGIDLTGNFVINRDSRTISITNSATTFCQSETPTVTSSVSAGGTDGTISYSIESGGTGTATINSSTGVITCTAPGTVIVKASISAGTNFEAAESETKTFTFTANPTAYAVSGTASICTGNSTNVTLANSQTGYTYKLYKDGSATSTTQTGTTGSALNFSVSEAGTYTVKGYVTDNESCIADMNNAATITIKNAVVNPQPELDNIHPYEVVTLTATNKEDVTWTITKTPDNVIIDKNAYFTEGNTGKTVKFKGALGDGYQITATADGCDTEINFDIIPDTEDCSN